VNQRTLRILDANFNRARESLRVIEDYLRFAADSQIIAELKSLRHGLAAQAKRLESLAGAFLPARDTPGDTGTALTDEAEASRPDEAAIVSAAFKRLQEALRVLEEYSKLASPEVAQTLKELRYRTYALESRSTRLRQYGERLLKARLYVLLTSSIAKRDIVEVARETIRGGADVVQLREKQVPDREVLRRALRLRELTAASGVLFIVNDRPDIAELSEADGVHLGQDELPPARVRRILTGGKLVGVSTHSLDQALQAHRDGADYIGMGPSFPSSTKDAGPLIGLDTIRRIVAEVPVPGFAIGGITVDRVKALTDLGCRRIAVSSAIIAADDVAKATEAFKALLA